MERHRTLAELEAGLAALPPAPRDHGTLELIVVRPDKGTREVVAERNLSRAGGVEGDHWAKGCWKSLDNGNPDPDVQICIMNARIIELIAGPRDNWAPAGDNLFVDFDVSGDALAAGTRLAVGTAELEITDVPHLGCAKFVERYGRDACAFVNRHKPERRRGVYARVVRDGVVRAGDTISRIAVTAEAAG